MPTRPYDDLPQPYGPGWWESWPGEVSRPAAAAALAHAAPPIPDPPVAMRFVRTLGEYMQAVRAAVPYLGEAAAAPVSTSHHVAARTLIGRVSRSASRGPSPSPLRTTAPTEPEHSH